MAKINARGARQLAAFNTERTIVRDGVSTVYAERWALRSDGALLHRIRWTHETGRERLDHTSGYKIHGKAKDLSTFDLRRFLERRGFTVTDGRTTGRL